MKSEPIRVSDPIDPLLSSPACAPADLWFAAAVEDYWLSRAFDRLYSARLVRSSRSRRIAWEHNGQPEFGILLPDLYPQISRARDDWYIYRPGSEVLSHRSAADRQRDHALILPDSVEDWVELLQLALREDIFDLRFAVSPSYVSLLGDIENSRWGFEIVIAAFAPAGCATSFYLTATGSTPEAAARESCRQWIAQGGAEVSPIEDTIVVH